MPATNADIAAAIREQIVATWADPALHGRYPSARDGTLDAAPGYFDSIADAAAAVAQRGALIGTERRRFAASADALVWIDPTTDGVPSVRIVDGEQAANLVGLSGSIEIDLETSDTTWEVFG